MSWAWRLCVGRRHQRTPTHVSLDKPQRAEMRPNSVRILHNSWDCDPHASIFRSRCCFTSRFRGTGPLAGGKAHSFLPSLTVIRSQRLCWSRNVATRRSKCLKCSRRFCCLTLTWMFNSKSCSRHGFVCLHRNYVTSFKDDTAHTHTHTRDRSIATKGLCCQQNFLFHLIASICPRTQTLGSRCQNYCWTVVSTCRKNIFYHAHLLLSTWNWQVVSVRRLKFSFSTQTQIRNDRSSEVNSALRCRVFLKSYTDVHSCLQSCCGKPDVEASG